MLKQFLNGGSLKSLMLYDKEDEAGTQPTEKEKLREQLAKGNGAAKPEADPDLDGEVEPDLEGDEDGEEGEEDEVDPDAEINPDETAEQKTAREAKEAETAKAKRKDDRIQKRIDKAVAAQRAAEAEIVKWRNLAEANPDKKLTEAEVNSRAETIAAEKVAAQEMERMQADFNKACDKLQGEATKLDKGFTPKVVAMADELGPIPSRVIGILSDFENGAEVLKFMVDDIDEAEKIYDLKDRPERLAIALVRLSDKLIADKKPKPKSISKVPDPVEQVKGSRVQTTAITEADTKNMDSYVRKRRLQQEALKKQRGGF